MKTKTEPFNLGMADGLRDIWMSYPEGLRDGITQKELHRQRRESKLKHHNKVAKRR